MQYAVQHCVAEIYKAFSEKRVISVRACFSKTPCIPISIDDSLMKCKPTDSSRFFESFDYNKHCTWWYIHKRYWSLHNIVLTNIILKLFQWFVDAGFCWFLDVLMSKFFFSRNSTIFQLKHVDMSISIIFHSNGHSAPSGHISCRCAVVFIYLKHKTGCLVLPSAGSWLLLWAHLHQPVTLE